MNPIPTAPIPITGLCRVKNTLGDTLCVTAQKQAAWGAQVIRGERHSTAILYKETTDLEELKSIIDQFLAGNYEEFEETIPTEGRKWVFLSMLGNIAALALGIVFLAFMISLFLRIEW